MSGRTSLLELAGALPHFVAMVSNDTGTAHFAQCYDVPAVVVLSGVDYGLFWPNPLYKNGYCVSVSDHHCFGCHGRCRYSGDDSRPFPCVAGISVNAVLEQLKKVLLRRKLL